MYELYIAGAVAMTASRHCERSEAIHDPGLHGLPRYARSDEIGFKVRVRCRPEFILPRRLEKLLGEIGDGKCH
jgi:hypothetical protein